MLAVPQSLRSRSEDVFDSDPSPSTPKPSSSLCSLPGPPPPLLFTPLSDGMIGSPSAFLAHAFYSPLPSFSSSSSSSSSLSFPPTSSSSSLSFSSSPIAPPNSLSTPHDMLSSSLSSLETPLVTSDLVSDQSTLRAHKSPQKFTFSSPSLLSASSSALFKGRAREIKIKQRLDFSEAEEEATYRRVALPQETSSSSSSFPAPFSSSLSFSASSSLSSSSSSFSSSSSSSSSTSSSSSSSSFSFSSLPSSSSVVPLSSLSSSFHLHIQTDAPQMQSPGSARSVFHDSSSPSTALCQLPYHSSLSSHSLFHLPLMDFHSPISSQFAFHSAFSPSPLSSSVTFSPAVYSNLHRPLLTSSLLSSSLSLPQPPCSALFSPQSFTSPSSFASSLSSSENEGPSMSVIPLSSSSAPHSRKRARSTSPSLPPPRTPMLDRDERELKRSPHRKTARKMSSDASRSCNCKRSRCLKMYCECFARGETCKDCKCQNCSNTERSEHQEAREKAMENVRSRDPNAFLRKKTMGSPEESSEPPMDQQRMMKLMLIEALTHGASPHTYAHGSTENSTEKLPPLLSGPRKGCNCKKSECRKKYCECFTAGVACHGGCKCVACLNTAVPVADVETVREQTVVAL